MSTALVPQQTEIQSSERLKEMDAKDVGNLLLYGDLAQLSPAGKLCYYKARCDELGLSYFSKPFEFINLNGKLQLYANAGCSAQLRKNHKISITILERSLTDEVYSVRVRAEMPDGRCDEAEGAVFVGNLKGAEKANAVMKAETKAKRRVTLSICGLGMLDETEAEPLIYDEKQKLSVHDLGRSHDSGICPQCAALGIPTGVRVAIQHGHLYRDDTPHDFEHGIQNSCAPCKAAWELEQSQKSQLPAVPPSAAVVPESATQGQGAAISDAAPKVSAFTPDVAESVGRKPGTTIATASQTTGQQKLGEILAGDAERKASKPITPQQRNALTKRAAELGWQDADFLAALKKFGCDRPHDILAVDYKRVCDFIETGGAML